MKNLFTILFILFTLWSNSQSVKVTYIEKSIISQERLDAMPPSVRGATLAEMSIPKLFELEYSDGVSFYQRDKNAKDFTYRSTSTTTDENGTLSKGSIIADKKLMPFFYYKEINNDLMLFKLTNSNINFDGKDELIKWDWEITEETKIINGYTCKKAISKKFNSLITAWFTEEIPIKAGPEKYDGLPGLILHLQNLGMEFIAEKIELKTDQITIVKPKQPLKTVTFLEMADQARNKFEKSINSRTQQKGAGFVRTEVY